MREETYINAACHFYDFFYDISLKIRYSLWTWRNPDKIKELKKLHKRIIRELAEYDIELPTKFIIKKYGLDAEYDENDDTISFPLAYMRPKFRTDHTTALAHLRHEYGHACMYHYCAEKGYDEVNELFGYAHTPYKVWKFICWKKRTLAWKTFVSKYAQTHPWEDFAECFAKYLQLKGKISKYKKRPVVYEKLQFVGRVIEELGTIDYSDQA